MTTQELKASLADSKPPEGLSQLGEALWWDAKGDWSRAHAIAQDIASSGAAWVHAYLHRKEGDASNAAYWYERAGKPHTRQSLDSEWDDIAETLLADVGP